MTSPTSGFPGFESIRSAVIEQGPSGIWDRLVGLVKGVTHGGSPDQNGYELAPKVAEQSPSAKYSSYEAEVRPLFVPYSPNFLPDE
jgi:Ca2+-transporting ATPase